MILDEIRLNFMYLDLLRFKLLKITKNKKKENSFTNV